MKRKIFTDEVIAKIPLLLAQGVTPAALTERLGCTYSTLKVRCSQAKISLRQPKSLPKPKQKLALTPRLNDMAMAYYRRQSDAAGISTVSLVTELLEIIAADDLLNAVLDNKQMKEAA